MKIIFNTIRYQNFLSSGNQWTEIKLNENSISLIVGINGAGKAQPLYSKILTPLGWNTIGNIKIGDEIVSANGDISKVIDIPFIGEENVYEITFKDGRKVKCGENHLFRVWGYFESKWQWKILSLLEILKEKENSLGNFTDNHFIQLFEAENFIKKDVDLPINPYLLGVLIGDGSFTSSNVTITNTDEELLNKVRNILDFTCPRIVKLHLSKVQTRCSYRINYGIKYEKHIFKEELKKLNLYGKRSWEKNIPELYKNISFNQKIELLRGLMDTDGTADRNGSISYSTTSYELAKDIQELIFSIGGICKISEKNPSFTNKGIKKKGRLSYQLNIRYKNPSELFSLSRKKERCKNYQYKDSLRLRIEKIEKIEKEIVKCISIDHPSQLYVTDNYVVTHNSTCLDALCFCLFKKPFRKVTLSLLVNSMTKKNCLVEIEFTIGQDFYKIIRGIKPNKFEIYKNNVLLNNTNQDDYQKYLEENILHINHKAFCQVCVLGSASYVPFLELPLPDRRKIVENLLDLEIFSSMNLILKKRIQDNEKNIYELRTEQNTLKNRIKLLEEYNKKRKEDNQKQILEMEEKLEEYRKSYLLKKKNIPEKFDTSKIEDELKTKESLYYKLGSDINNLKLENKKLEKEMYYYENTCVCNVCNQNIDETFKDIIIQEKRIQHTHNLDQVKIYQRTYDKLELEIDKFNDSIKSMKEVNSKIDLILYELKNITSLANELKIKINSFKNENVEDKTEEILQLQNSLENYIKNYDNLVIQKENMNILLKLLRDDGVKASIIKQYIEVINELINKFLLEMDFICQFTVDENFNEVIKSRYRDEHIFQSFSQGEKMRINLALLFTFREVAKRRNSLDTNLLIFDETLDGSMDADGIDSYLNILKRLTKDENVFIISHNEKNKDRIENIIEFKKEKGFSKIVK
jgi:DNA repair exonuclease SbcCD ATPase subunit/intein/homing endonuclease